MQWLIARLELIAPALCFIVGALVVRFVLPYQWGFDFDTQRHFIYFKQYDEIEGRMIWEAGRRFSLLLRLFLVAAPSVYLFMTAPILIRRFKDEVRIPVPTLGEKLSDVGLDTRKWGPKEEPAQAAPAKEVRIRKVAETARGDKVEGYDDIPENYIDAIRLAFEALNAGTIARISRAEVAKVQGIGQHVARAVTGLLRDLGYIEYPNGDNNAAKLTDYGRGLAEAVENGEF